MGLQAVSNAMLPGEGGEVTVSVGQVGSPLRLTGAWITASKTITSSGQLFTVPFAGACQNGAQRRPGGSGAC